MIPEIPTELLKNPHFSRYYRTWERNPLSVVFVPLAQIGREQGHLEVARAICKKGLEQHPNSVSGRILLARILYDLDELAEAQTLTLRILDEFPGQQEALSLLDRILKGREGESTSTPSPQSASAPNGEKMERESEGISIWENPTMAKIYADQGEVRVARQMLERILTRDPTNQRALDLRKVLGA